MKLEEAIAKLDHDNDAHWTDDGAPRVDVLKELTGNHSLSRKEITDAAPSLQRGKENAEDTDKNETPEVSSSVQKGSGEGSQVSDGVQPDKTADNSGTGSEAVESTGQPSADLNESDWSKSVRSMNSQIDSLESVLKEAHEEKKHLDESISEINCELEDLRTKIRLGNEPPMNDAEARQAFMKKSSKGQASLAAQSASIIAAAAGLGKAKEMARMPAHLLNK